MSRPGRLPASRRAAVTSPSEHEACSHEAATGAPAGLGTCGGEAVLSSVLPEGGSGHVPFSRPPKHRGGDVTVKRRVHVLGEDRSAARYDRALPIVETAGADAAQHFALPPPQGEGRACGTR